MLLPHFSSCISSKIPCTSSSLLSSSVVFSTFPNSRAVSLLYTRTIPTVCIRPSIRTIHTTLSIYQSNNNSSFNSKKTPKSLSLSGSVLHNTNNNGSLGRMRPQLGDPHFRDIWRKFQLLVHPDLFTTFPDIQAKNSSSLQILQGILNDAKTMERDANDLIKPRTETMEFFIRAHRIQYPANNNNNRSKSSSNIPTNLTTTTKTDNHFIRIPLTIRVTGSHFQHVLADSLISLFKYCGLPTRWHWGNEYWNSIHIYDDGKEKQQQQQSTNNNDNNNTTDNNTEEEETHGRQRNRRRNNYS